MNYNYSGQFGSPRRKSPPSMPQCRYTPRESIISRSDLSPSDDLGCITVGRGASGRDHKQNDNCSARPLAMVYSPRQCFSALYDEDTALSRGTLFSELDLPFDGKKCGKERR